MFLLFFLQIEEKISHACMSINTSISESWLFEWYKLYSYSREYI